MLFPKHIQSIICQCAHKADREARIDLVSKYISSENDYTSNFTSNFRKEINANGVLGLRASSQVLGARNEQHFGVDAAVILANKSNFKVGLFEAKWPRIGSRQYAWDKLQGGVSHFHDQLCRQRPYFPNIAIWEMYYCELQLHSQHTWFPNEGSACIWHDTAYQESEILNNNNQIWNNTELERVLRKGFLTISEIMSEICECKKGALFSGTYSINEFLDVADFLFRNVVVVQYSGGFEG